MSDKPVYIVGHNDVDGVCAHALTERRLGGRKAAHYFLDYPNAVETFSRIRGLKDSDIVFVDMSANGHSEEIKGIVTALKNGNNRIEWYDHHDWSEENVAAFSGLVDKLAIENGMVCATEIIQQRYLKKDENARRLAAAAHASDFDEKTDAGAHELAMYLQDVIAYADVLDRKNGNDNEMSWVAGRLAKGILKDEKFDSFHKNYQPIKEASLLKIEKTLTHLKVNGYDAIFALVPEELPMKTGLSKIIENRETADVHVGVMPSGRIFVRTSGAVPEEGLMKMVKPFDGGGRGRMGGGLFKYGRAVGESNYKEVFGLIAGKMDEALAGSYYVDG